MYTYNFKNVGETFTINVPKDLNKLDILKPEKLKEQYGGSYKVYFNVQNTTAKFLTFYIKTTILCAVSPKSDFSCELPQEVFTDYMIECKTMQNDDVFIADSGTDIIVTFTEGMSLGYSNNYNNNFKNLGGINPQYINFSNTYKMLDSLGDGIKYTALDTKTITYKKGTFISKINITTYPIVITSQVLFKAEGSSSGYIVADYITNETLKYYPNMFIGNTTDNISNYDIQYQFTINNTPTKIITISSTLNGNVYNTVNRTVPNYNFYYDKSFTFPILNINNFLTDDLNIKCDMIFGKIYAQSSGSANSTYRNFIYQANSSIAITV